MDFQIECMMTPLLGEIVKVVDSKYEAPLSKIISASSRSIMIVLAKRAQVLGVDLEQVAANEGIKIILTIQPPESGEHHCGNCMKHRMLKDDEEELT